MNRFLTLVLLAATSIIFATAQSGATPSLRIGDLAAERGESGLTLDVSLSNPGCEVQGLQFDITLPERVELTGFTTSERSAAHTMSYNLYEGTYSCIMISMSGASLSGTDGKIGSFTVALPSRIAPGEYTIDVTNIKVSDQDNRMHRLADCSGTLTVHGDAFTPGDVNGDGEFSALDVAMVVSFVLGSNPAGGSREAADINGDGNVSALDVAMMVSLVLSAQ